MDKNKAAVDIFDKYAADYHQRFMDVGHYADTLDVFLGQMENSAKVLEVACGPGNIARFLLDRRPDLQILGTDLAPQMLALARDINPEAQFELLDARAVGSLGRSWQGLMSGFCLPYFSREEALQFIDDAAKVLWPGGVLYLSTMEDDYSKSGWRKGSQGDEIYMHFHEADYLVAALVSAGFEVLTLKRQPYPPVGEASAIDLILVAQLI